ncbi:low molecular weight phosphotyrosine protein phosphatase [Proteobacteria bacterium 005FR1]|nr:low molecular weight phosphotyrosine protein phosphatase [Proteobacteria bacterium 005FR1]
MAEYLLRHKLMQRNAGDMQSHSAPHLRHSGEGRNPSATDRRNPEPPSGIKIESAGIGALVGKPAAETTLQILTEQGIDASAHRARQLTENILTSADLVLAMEQKHLAQLYEMAPQIRGRAFLLGKWNNDQEIPDPYRQQRPAFDHVYRLVDQATSAWLPYLA